MPDLASEAELVAFGRRLAALLREGDVILLEGGLGAGKTTFTRGILRGLGHEGEVPSPSFAIVQPYDVPDVRLPLAHVDLYRLDGPDDLPELGLDDYLADGALVIEWPDRLGGEGWNHALSIRIDVREDGIRRLTAQAPEAWRGRWPLT